jgi:integrase
MDLDEIFAAKKITASSLHLYKTKLFRLAKTKEIKNVNFLKDESDIAKNIEELKLSTKRSYYIAIVSFLKCLLITDDKPIYQTLYDKYYVTLKEFNTKLENTTEKTDTESANWITQDEVEQKQVQLSSIKDIIKNKKIITQSQYDKLLDYLLLSLYTCQPPRRSIDYIKMQVKKKIIDKDIPELKINTLDIFNKRFIFNTYKTKSTYKTQMVEINNELMGIIKLYLKFHPNKKELITVSTAHVGQRPTGNVNLIVNFDGSPFKSSSTLTKRFNKIFGSKISTAMLRKIYLTSKYKNVMNNLKEDAFEMGTSENTIKNHYVKQ